MVISPARFQEIPLSSVDLADHPYVFSPPAALDRLIASIEAVGLLAPPWLKARGDGRWQVVAGLKRLMALAYLGRERTPAFCLPAEAPEPHCLLIALYDNAFTRGFNLLEQARFAARFLDHWDRETVVAKLLPCLGLPPSYAHLERLIALSSLEASFKELAGEGRLALTAAALLARWTPEDRAAVLPVFQNLPLSQSKQEEVLENLTLLARREGASPGEIFSRLDTRDLLNDPRRTPQEKAEALRDKLKGLVQPRFSAARKSFQAALQGLALNPRLRLMPPPAFEGPDFTIEVKFRDPEELSRLLEEMTRLLNNDDFSKLTSS